MRGKEHRSHVSGVGPGITPAYAGKRKNTTSSSISTKDHPRVCGEKLQREPRTLSPPGSPPRMRGKAVLGSAVSPPERITPAYAGKRSPPIAALGKHRDHPRVCGEKKLTLNAGKLIPGSPPRMRGKADKDDVSGLDLGITPAYAGKRCSGSAGPHRQRDHPRVCGEKNNLRQAFAVQQGSPPRMRGKEARFDVHCTLLGITPAYAGKRSPMRPSAP